MTGARYLHQLGRHADGPFISCELNTANARKPRAGRWS